MPAVEAAMLENADTPCVRSIRCLLLGAVAAEVAGDPEQSLALERLALAGGFESHHWALVGPHLRLAVVRGDTDGMGRLVAERPPVLLVFGAAPTAARLDAIAALRDAARAEGEAVPLLRAGAYVEPFALRTLGIVREDDAMLARADERFAALGLEWYRAQTDALLSV
jgi:hypothetical protein